MPKNKTTRKKPDSRKEPDGPEIYDAPHPPDNGRLVGVDCHPDTFTAAVVRGTTVHNAEHLLTKGGMDLAALVAWAEDNFTGDDLFLTEAGSNSFEVCRRLEEKGLRAVVLESAFVGHHAGKYADNDAIAALRIAMVFLGCKAPCVWVPDERTRQLREILHEHIRNTTRETSDTNALKGWLNQHGIRPGKKALHTPKTREWIQAQREWSALEAHLLNAHFERVDTAVRQRRSTLAAMAATASGDPAMLALMTLLGIGLVNAFALVAVIGDIRRFSEPKKLAAYLGLNPGQKTSGKSKMVKIGVGRRGRKDMRCLLLQAAHAVLRTRGENEIGRWGRKLMARKGNRNVAAAGVARKLAMRIWHLLAGNTPDGLEPDKRLRTKFGKTLTLIGKTGRAGLGMPGTVKECVRLLEERMRTFTPTSVPSPAKTG